MTARMSSSRISRTFLSPSILNSSPAYEVNSTCVADLDLELAALAVLGDPPVADGHDLALLRLVLGRVRQHDPAGRRLLGLFPLHHHAIAQRLEFHRPGLPVVPSCDKSVMPANDLPLPERNPKRQASTRGRTSYFTASCNLCAFGVTVHKFQWINAL